MQSLIYWSFLYEDTFLTFVEEGSGWVPALIWHRSDVYRDVWTQKYDLFQSDLIRFHMWSWIGYISDSCPCDMKENCDMGIQFIVFLTTCTCPDVLLFLVIQMTCAKKKNHFREQMHLHYIVVTYSYECEHLNWSLKSEQYSVSCFSKL